MKLNNQYSEHATTNYTKAQTSSIGKALLWAGGGFSLVALVAFLISYFLFNEDAINKLGPDKIQTMYAIFWPIAIVCSIIGSILMITWSFNIANVSWTRIIFTYILEIIFWGFSFGIIMGIYSGFEMAIAIGMTGLIFLIMGIIGSVMSTKAALTLSKIVGIGMGVLLFVNLIFFLVSYLPFRNGAANNIWWLVACPLFTIFAMLYIAIDFYMISKMQLFSMNLEPQQIKKVNSYFGLKLLTDFAYLLYWILIIIRNIRSR